MLLSCRPRAIAQLAERIAETPYSVCKVEQVFQRGAATEWRPDGAEGNRLWLIGKGHEEDAGSRQQRRARTDNGGWTVTHWR